MSPEQTMGKPVDQRADIWALGVVIAEMVSGKNPFGRETAPATILAILNESPHLPDEISLELRRIIYRSLSKDPATRYSRCDELLADLEALHGALESRSDQVSQLGKSPADLRKAEKYASGQALRLTSQPKKF